MQESELKEEFRKLHEGQRLLVDMLKDISRAFPRDEFDEPDYDGHRKYHQQLIQKAAEAEKDRQEAVKSVVHKGVWLGLTIIGVALLDYIKAKFK
jgi:hypothetical protein